MNAPEVTRAGSRRPGACLGTNIAPRSTAGTTYSRAFMLPLPHPGRHRQVRRTTTQTFRPRTCLGMRRIDTVLIDIDGVLTVEW